jgi:hypothetical protein
VFGHGRGDRSRSRATPAQSGRIPTHEPERRRRLSLPAARAAPPASSRPFPQPGPSPRSPSYAAAIAVYLVLGQHLPVERTASLLAEVFGTPMSTGTVAAWTARAAAGLAPFTAAARRRPDPGRAGACR